MVDAKSALKITTESFDQITGKGVSVVDFWAEWCMPCRMQGPIVEQVARKMGDCAAVCKLNVDDYPEPAQRFGVTGIPTMIFFKDGAEAGRLVGVQSEASIVRTLETLLS
jgi:thioredoxin 1